MRKIIVAGIAFVLLVGGFIVYMEIEKRKFIDSISSVSPVVDQPMNGAETTREVTQASEEPKFQEVDRDELLAAVNRIPEQFGYSEASTTYAKLQAKRMSGEKLTLDDSIARLEASLYLWPNEHTRRSLILEKWKQSKGPSYDRSNGYSDEDIAELKELGIPVVSTDDFLMINPPPDTVLREWAEDDTEKYRDMWRKVLEYRESSPPASKTLSLERMGEDTVSSPNRSEVFPAISESGLLDTSEHVHYEDEHVHEPPTIQPPTPADVKSVEARGWEGLSLKQREEAKQLFNRYGTAEGLRRLRETDPDAAAQFDWERRESPVPSEPNDEPSTR